jgi:ubiquinol-cytochrome c reductase cytochrome c1 subunit
MKLRIFLTVFLLALGVTTASHAGGAAPDVPQHAWSFDGAFGTFDQQQLQRGLKVYKEVCAACHAMHLVSYRNLSMLGYTEDEIKAYAATFTVTDGPNDQGEMFERPALPSDSFVSPYPNEQAARATNNGAYPPDQSLIVKARNVSLSGGASYIRALMLGYSEPPAGITVPEGKHYNKYMPGNVIAMAPPLSDSVVTYEDGSPETVEQYATDVAAFLAWASEPHMAERKQTGVRVVMFLVVLTGLFYAAKRKIWARAK